MNVRSLFRAILFLLILHFTFYILHSHIYAKDFNSLYKTTYEFTTEEVTKVNQEVSLINQSPDFYVSEYNLSLVGGKVTKIEAFDRIGRVQASSSVKDETTLINLKFNEKAVGKGKVLSFILKYNVSDLVKKEGNLWRISVPKLSNGKEIDDYQLTLKVPSSMGKLAYVSPSPSSSEESKDGFYFFHFKKEDLEKFGVSATFGHFQTFSFRLLYDLKNSSLSRKVTKIAIPPDTNYQTVIYNFIEPEPENVEIDEDGNWLAEYTLSPGQIIKVEAMGNVNIFSLPKSEFPKKTTALSEFSVYLNPKENWQTENSELKKIAKELKTPQNIYKYVVQTLKYDERAISKNARRKSALTAFLNPESCLCTEFTDLFITLCRAAGIPARELQGYAYTDNPKFANLSVNNDLLHSWPEYFDKNGWIMVDPTWENTTGGLDFFNKFDMTHFVFAIHGKDDIFPFPAGSYRLDGQDLKDKQKQGKQIFITFGKENNNLASSMFIIEGITPQTVYSFQNSLMEVIFKNKNGFAVYSGKLNINSPFLINPGQLSFNAVPPFGHISYNFWLKPKERLKDYQLEISFDLNNQSLSSVIIVKSFIFRAIIFVGFIVSAVIIIFLISLKRKSLFTNKQLFSEKQNDNLRSDN